MVKELGVVSVGQEAAVGEEGGQVVDEYEEEDWSDDGTLGYSVGQWERNGGAAAYRLFSVGDNSGTMGTAHHTTQVYPGGHHDRHCRRLCSDQASLATRLGPGQPFLRSSRQCRAWRLPWSGTVDTHTGRGRAHGCGLGKIRVEWTLLFQQFLKALIGLRLAENCSYLSGRPICELG